MASNAYVAPALSRCVAIIERLQREPATVYELSALLNASKRTIDRDIGALIELGAPITELPRTATEAQRYAISPDWSAPAALYDWLRDQGNATGQLSGDRKAAIAERLRAGQTVQQIRNSLGVDGAAVRAVQATIQRAIHFVTSSR